MEIKDVTTLVLENVENLLLENRIMDIKKKYPKIYSPVIDELVEMDPSSNNKYLAWLAKTLFPYTIKWYKENPHDSYWKEDNWTTEEVPNTWDSDVWDEDRWDIHNLRTDTDHIEELIDNLEHFHQNPTKYEIKDINGYEDELDLASASEIAKKKLSRKEEKNIGVDKLYEDDDFLLLLPKTHKAACRYGSKTKWCVTQRNDSQYFEQYYTNGPIFFLIDKREIAPTNSMKTQDFYKIAVHYKPDYGNFSSNGRTAFSQATKMKKDSFVNLGKGDNVAIDFWDSVDRPQYEDVIIKYLGGPGRGQKERGNKVLSTIIPIMEKYTTEYMGRYWETVQHLKDESKKLKNWQKKKEQLEEEVTYLQDRAIELDSVVDNLREYVEYGLEDEDHVKFINNTPEANKWVRENLKKAEEFRDQLLKKQRKMESRIDKFQDKINKGYRAMDKNVLNFYDKEKHVTKEW